MLTLAQLFSGLGQRMDPTALRDYFVPPPRFARKQFESYEPRHPSQAEACGRLREIAAELSRPRAPARFRLLRRSRERERKRARAGRGVYLDGGFGVGKTHLLASLWNSAPEPKSYLSFDELMHFIGLAGPDAASEAFRGHRLIAIDEWELDDPGNLKLALAFLRRALADGALVAVTSNTLPIELGAGRFSQKDFRVELEELASAFEVIRVLGDDYRHRDFARERIGESYTEPDTLAARLAEASPTTLRTSFEALIPALGEVHPIQYRMAGRRFDLLLLDRIAPLHSLVDALRWVHFIDSLYVRGTAIVVLEGPPLTEIFSEEALAGPYAKKLLRCLSRMTELLGPNFAPFRNAAGVSTGERTAG